MDCRVKTVMPVKLELNPDRVSILDLMDCRVKTIVAIALRAVALQVSILDLMDCRVKTPTVLHPASRRAMFQSLI